MNTTLITTLNKHYIYLVKSAQIPFYIAVPYKEFNQTNISIEFYAEYEKLDVNKNDLVWVTDEITRIYREVDNDNISLVIPVFGDNLIKQTLQLNDSNMFNVLDAQISGVINAAYQTLTSNNVKVDSKIIIINNNQFGNFVNWFLGRYASRVEFKTYFDLKNIGVIPDVNVDGANKPNISNNSINYNNMNNNTVSPQINEVNNSTDMVNHMSVSGSINNVVNPNMNFVTKSDTPAMGKTEVNEMRANSFVPANEQLEVPQASGSAGYVSYLLLGIVTAIVSFVVLYLIF